MRKPLLGPRDDGSGLELAVKRSHGNWFAPEGNWHVFTRTPNAIMWELEEKHGVYDTKQEAVNAAGIIARRDPRLDGYNIYE